MIDDPLYIAIDLGAGSGRVFLADAGTDGLSLEELRRFSYPASHIDRHLRWPFPKILDEIKTGLIEAGKFARDVTRRIGSIGVDSWGVDYGLIDADGELVENPICYRDQRTKNVLLEVFKRVPREEIFRRTGIQLLSFNTLFQLCAHAGDRIPEKAARLLMIPDLVNCFLTGQAVTEYTNATTTQMLNATTGTWDRELIESVGLPSMLLSDIVPAGTDLSVLKPALSDELSLQGVRVIAPATHDTGSAVAGTPLENGWAYISSGTWSLVGVERETPLINDEVARSNFTNEGGVFGTVRFLKNVMGLWILEACRKEWQQRGVAVNLDELLHDVAAMGAYSALIFPDDQRFLNPPSMLEAIATQLNETDQTMPSEPAAIAKVILDSLAIRYASVLRTIESLTNQAIKGVRIIGGGSQNAYLNQATANATGLPVVSGPVEATVLGNVLVQGIASGRFGSLADAREYVARKIRSETFRPKDSVACEDAIRRYAKIEARYI